MIVTDEQTNQIELMKSIVYYLTLKMGGEVAIDFNELNELFLSPETVCRVRDIPGGIAFKVTTSVTQRDVDLAFLGY